MTNSGPHRRRVPSSVIRHWVVDSSFVIQHSSQVCPGNSADAPLPLRAAESESVALPEGDAAVAKGVTIRPCESRWPSPHFSPRVEVPKGRKWVTVGVSPRKGSGKGLSPEGAEETRRSFAPSGLGGKRACDLWAYAHGNVLPPLRGWRGEKCGLEEEGRSKGADGSSGGCFPPGRFFLTLSYKCLY